jgi:serralysin
MHKYARIAFAPIVATWSVAAFAQSPIPTREAAQALASLGVVTHLDYRGTPYEKLDRVSAALRHVGIRRLRDMIPDANARPYEQLAAQGIKFNFVVRGGEIADLGKPIATLEALEQRFPGVVASIEGINEANLWPAKFRGLGDFAAAVAVQRELRERVKASAILHSVPIYALTLGGVGEKAFDRLGDLSDDADMGNAHVYFGTRPPSATLDFATRLARRATPRLTTMVITETGYASSGKRGQAVDEAVQAKYLLTLIAESWRRETPATFVYQLVDDKRDPDNWSYNLGLYRVDWTPKPAADAFHHLNEAVSEVATGGNGAPCATDLDLGAGAQATRALWLKGAHGCALLVWRDQPLWDDDANAPRATQPLLLHAVLKPRAQAITIIDPLDGKRRNVNGDAQGYPLELRDHPILLRWP